MRLCGTCLDVPWKMIDHRQAGLRFPEIVDTETLLGITRVATVLHMPIDIIWPPSPASLVRVAATWRISDTILNLNIPQASTAVDTPLMAFGR